MTKPAERTLEQIQELQYWGSAEAAKMLGIGPTNFSHLKRKEEVIEGSKFPLPFIELQCGPIWTKTSMLKFKKDYDSRRRRAPRNGETAATVEAPTKAKATKATKQRPRRRRPSRARRRPRRRPRRRRLRPRRRRRPRSRRRARRSPWSAADRHQRRSRLHNYALRRRFPHGAGAVSRTGTGEMNATGSAARRR